MDLATIDLLIVLGMIVVVMAIGVRGYRVSGSITGYFLAGRGLGPWVLAFSIMATYFSAASFLAGGTTYLYNLGFGAWLTAWHIIGVVLMWTLVAERLFRYSSKTNIVSVPDFIEHRYQSKGAKMISASVILLLFTLYLTSVYKGGAVILATVLNVKFEVALLLLALPVIILRVYGGAKGGCAKQPSAGGADAPRGALNVLRHNVCSRRSDQRARETAGHECNGQDTRVSVAQA
jgi:Na+/proline symporter